MTVLHFTKILGAKRESSCAGRRLRMCECTCFGASPSPNKKGEGRRGERRRKKVFDLCERPSFGDFSYKIVQLRLKSFRWWWCCCCCLVFARLISTCVQGAGLYTGIRDGGVQKIRLRKLD